MEKLWHKKVKHKVLYWWDNRKWEMEFFRTEKEMKKLMKVRTKQNRIEAQKKKKQKMEEEKSKKEKRKQSMFGSVIDYFDSLIDSKDKEPDLFDEF